MPPSTHKLASALADLRVLQQDGARVFASHQLTRTSRERLLKYGFLQEVMKGWLMSASPETRPGDTTPWFASFWEFCTRYCDDRFGAEWTLSPEQSLLLHAANTAIPKQVIVRSPHAHNNRIDLLFGTSLFALGKAITAADVELVHGLRVCSIAAALVRVTEEFFHRNPIEARIVAARIREPSALLAHLLEGSHTVIAGRLAGLFRGNGQLEIADEILATMKAADHDIREVDPLTTEVVTVPPPASTPAIAARLRLLWASMRDVVLEEFPGAPGLPRAAGAYLKAIDEVYALDAYHSLSIEGYQVTPDLIERVAFGRWSAEHVLSDRDDRNALAARGYWLAFRRARVTMTRILDRELTSKVVRTAHREWYRELFQPSVAAGMIAATTLAGYRRTPVYLRGSRHVPPRWESLPDAMPALFDLIDAEPEPAVRAVLGHWLVGYVHPFPDGNGRIARFLMNTMFASGGYPWTVIRVEDRASYLSALETASTESNVRPFARFVVKQMAKPKKRLHTK